MTRAHLCELRPPAEHVVEQRLFQIDVLVMRRRAAATAAAAAAAAAAATATATAVAAATAAVARAATWLRAVGARRSGLHSRPGAAVVLGRRLEHLERGKRIGLGTRRRLGSAHTARIARVWGRDAEAHRCTGRS